MDEIRFDDVDALRSKISEDFGPFGRSLVVSQDMIDRFADLTGDRQWIHVDPDRCRKESPFGTTVAHGFLVLSLLPQLVAGTEGGGYRVVGAGNVLNYGSDGLRFVSPVPAGSSVHARRRLTGVEGTSRGTRITSEIAIHVVGSDRPALAYTALTLFQPPRE